MKTYGTFVASSLLAALALMPSAADAAQGDGHWYATGTLGAAFSSSQTLDYSSPAGAASASASFDPGLLAGGAVGYAFNPSWRVEGEFIYQSVEHDGVDLAGIGSLPSGNYASTGLALNGFYSFNAFGSDKVRTYIGAGLAWLTEVDIDFEQGGNELSYSGDGFGVQLLAGARYEVGERWFVDAGVRYLTAGEVELDGEGATDGRIKADYEPWSATLSVGWRF
jgi:outer membrane protein W